MFCSKAGVAACPVTGTTGSIPVRQSNLAGDSAATILGCINAEANKGDLQAKGCPTALPVAGDYTFFVAAGTEVTAAPTVAVGNVVECRINDATRSCGSLAQVRKYNELQPAGCIALAGSKPCPSSGYTSTYSFGLYGPAATNDATAKLDACVTISQSVAADATTKSCGLVVPASTYTIPVTSDSPADAAVTNAALQGCARANTACPASPSIPMIDSSMKITSCRVTANPNTCGAAFVPLCDASVVPAAGPPVVAGNTLSNTGVCDAANTKGCLAAAGATFTQCAQLTSTSNYPTATTYKFVVSLQSAATSTLVSCANMGTLTACNAASPFDVEAYPTSEYPPQPPPSPHPSTHTNKHKHHNHFMQCTAKQPTAHEILFTVILLSNPFAT